MTRVLIVGCGCRGQGLARTLLEEGHTVRGTTRAATGRAAVEATGAEAWIGDPDRVGTLTGALDSVTVVCWLLGSARGPDESLRALHGPRLRAFCERLVDTTVRGLIYEAAGKIDRGVLACGRGIVEEAAETWAIPVRMLDTDPTEHERWLADAQAAVNALLAAPHAGGARDGFRYTRPTNTHLTIGIQEEASVADYANDVLVDTQWLEDHLEDDSIRIVEVDENPALYADAHIPGAIGFDWKTDLQDQVKRDFLGPEAFGELFGNRGISNDHLIVLYGDRNNWFAAYTYWYLKYYGHDNVKLVNGPREKWIGEGRATAADPPDFEAATFNVQSSDDSIRAKRGEVHEALDEDVRLVDVRSPQEFSGELIAMAGYEQEGAQRGGHIPGAASVPWAQAVNEDGTFKSADELRELYTGKGVINGAPIIAYCRIGERSAHTWFVLHELLGNDDVKNYDGSWTEWGNLVDVPIEKGA